MFEFEKFIFKQILAILEDENSLKFINKVHKVVIKIKEKTFIRQYVDQKINVKSALKECYRECILPIQNKFKEDDIVEWKVKCSCDTVIKLPDKILQITKTYWQSQDYFTEKLINPTDHPDWMVDDNGKVLCGYRTNNSICGYASISGRWTTIDMDTGVIEYSSTHEISPLTSLKKVQLDYLGKFQIKQVEVN
jgi:hypothetical protein